MTETEPPTPAPNAAPPPPPAPAPVELHPRKRKMKQSREQTNAQTQQQNADNGDSSAEARGEVHPHDQPITNCYKLFMNIRQQVRVSLVSVDLNKFIPVTSRLKNDVKVCFWSNQNLLKVSRTT